MRPQKREMRGGEINRSRPVHAQWGATGAEHAGTIPSTPENAPFPDQASEFYYNLPVPELGQDSVLGDFGKVST